MKAFEQPDGTVSRDHYYVLARNPATGEEAHFAFPKDLIVSKDAIEWVRSVLPDGWHQYDLEDRTYGSVTRDDAERWSRDFLTELAVSAMTSEATS